MPVFTSWRAFENFEREVRRNRRYIRTSEAEQFLETVRATSISRTLHLSANRGFWRAQAGHTWRHDDSIDDEIPAAFPPDRMKPLEDRAMEGRANPRGIPVLYLCTNKEAAMSEVRPWLGSMISLGYFETNRSMKVVDCTREISSGGLFYFEEPPVEKRETTVWACINKAYTRPVTRSDDIDEYVSTQIIAELFRESGFDGIAYRSAFGESSKNLALFDRNCADLKRCQLFEMTKASFNFRERDNPYWVKLAAKPKKSM